MKFVKPLKNINMIFLYNNYMRAVFVTLIYNIAPISYNFYKFFSYLNFYITLFYHIILLSLIFIKKQAAFLNECINNNISNSVIVATKCEYNSNYKFFNIISLLLAMIKNNNKILTPILLMLCLE